MNGLPPAPPAASTARQLPRTPASSAGFTRTDLLVTLAVLAVLLVVVEGFRLRSRDRAGLTRCLANLQAVNRAVLGFAQDHQQRLPRLDNSPAPGGWWWYKELVKGYAGLTGDSSPRDVLFACPQDRGYDEGVARPQPFRESQRHDFTSYVFNGVTLPGLPHIAGRSLPSLHRPERTLLVMEWTAHAPLSWHRSLTGRANAPFYNNAHSAVGFVDGHAAFIPIYYDGLNAAYTRDPAPGYAYSYSGD